MQKKLSDFNIPGPFRAEQLKSGDPYELSNGHPIECLPTGGRGSRANLIGGSVLDSDPQVESAGVDTGFATAPGTLRAPDVAVGNVADEPGWVTGKAPPLAVEYADTGQDEDELGAKIHDLQAGGTDLVWVVRLVGPRRVEVHRQGERPTLAYPGEALEAPGILRNPVPVLALFDREAAHEATLRNLLQRKGYRDLDQVRDDGRAEGKVLTLRNAVLLVLTERGIEIGSEQRAALDICDDPVRLQRWLTQVATAEDAAEIFEPPRD
jgi:Uma2 family endonuclease